MSKDKKARCPVSRAEFREKAKPVTFTLLGRTFTMDPREFETGSLGWNASDKVVIKVGDRDVTVQVGLNITLVGSKELPQ